MAHRHKLIVIALQETLLFVEKKNCIGRQRSVQKTQGQMKRNSNLSEKLFEHHQLLTPADLQQVENTEI